jgi:uncharacterized protein YeaO (DUF488 family)/5-formyltetrahydrofolate cyclo-ligase
VSAEERSNTAERVTAMLDVLIGEVETPVVSTYWPFRGELDLRPWMTRLTDAGARVVLPVVVEKAHPLIFREWAPGWRMERGVWNIPVPAEGGGAGTERRDLARGRCRHGRLPTGTWRRFLRQHVGGDGWPPLGHRHRASVGVHPSARIATIYPQPHDVPMDVVGVGRGDLAAASMSDIRIKRAYRTARVSDGARILVDRIWPRGMAKDRLRLTEWMKDVAPSDYLRRWFGHDPQKWEAFRETYFYELANKKDAVSRLVDLAAEGRLTLVYGAKDETHNNAAALKEHLEHRKTTE